MHVLSHQGFLCAQSERGWKRRVVQRPGNVSALLLTNFTFGRVDYLYGHTDRKLRWPGGGILISITDWTGAATKAMKSEYPSSGRLRVAAKDFAPFEGVANLGQRRVRFEKHLLELWVQARPTTIRTITEANRELARVSVCG
ncbi:MAG: hypothetical protein ACJ757_02425 [Gaiellaceae bacterium]